jgi:PAS domain S-box-containing protein
MPGKPGKTNIKKGNPHLLSEILNSLTDGVFALDREWNFIFVNHVAAANVGFKPEELLGQNLWNKLPRIINTPHEVYYRKVMVDREIQRFEIPDMFSDKFYSIVVYPTSKGITVRWHDITEHKGVVDAVRESEEKYRSLFNNITEGFILGEIILDDKGKPVDYIFREVNPAFEKGYGLSREKMVGKKVSEVSPGVDSSWIEIFGKVALTGQPVVFEKYGSVTGKWLEVHAFSPQKSYFAALYRDVTDSKRAEEALKDSEERLRLSQEIAHIGTFDWNIKTGVNIWTPQLEAIYGLRPGSFARTQPAWEKLVYPEDRTKAVQLVKQTLKSGAPVTGVWRVQWTDGSIHWISGRFQAFKDSTGKPVRMTGVNIDVTERMKLEKALAKAKDKLEEKVKERTRELEHSEEKYRLLVENANEAVLVYQEGRYPFFNPKSLELFGYSREEFADISDAQVVHPDDLGMVRKRYRQRIQGKDVPSSYEIRVIRKDGSTRWVYINVVVISWEGRPATLILKTDITERKQMEQSLHEYALRITQVQEEERKRIAFELHDDTAQYLSILKMELEALIESGKIQDPQVVEKLQFLEKDAGRAFNDVRRYSHELRPGVLEHLGLLAALEQIAEDVNKLGQIRVEVTIEGEEFALSEEIKLGFFRIAQEAISNARKHSKASMATIHLDFRDKQVSMVVSDNGVGFNSQEVITRAGLKGNLGFVSMKERAKLIGASLRIESQPGQGTTVKVEMSISN